MDISHTLPATAPVLVSGPLARTLFVATLPLALALAVLFGVQLAEAWLVARLGGAALAALGFALPVSLTVLSFGVGLGAGASAAVARALGARDPTAPALATDALILTALLAVPLAAAGWLAAPALLAALGAEGEVLALASGWLRLFLFGAVPLLICMVALSLIRAAGDTRFQGAALAGAGLLAFALDWPLAFGVAGWPGLGLRGVAVAGALAWSATLVLALWRLNRLGLLRPSEARHGFVHSARRILRIAVPAAATNAIIPAANGLFTAMLAAQGAAAVAGFGVGGRIEALVLTTFFALSAVANPFAAQNAGAGRLDRVHAGARAMLLFCAAGGAVLAVLAWLFGGWLAGHLARDPAVATAVARYLAVLGAGWGAVGAIAVVTALFNGLERPFAAVAVSLARTFVLGVPLAWAGGQVWGEVGVLGGILAANLVAAGLGAAWVLRATAPERSGAAVAVRPAPA